MNTTNVRRLAMVGLLIALQIVLTRIFSIQLPTNRISFQFLPLALTGIMFGPMYGAIAAAVANVVGAILFPPTGGFFIGFTLTAGFSGAIFGLILYRRPKNLFNISLSVVCVSVVQLVLNTIWLYIILDVGILAMLPNRVTLALIMLPIQIYTLLFFCNFIMSRLNIRYD